MKVGIDLGTTFSAIARVNTDGKAEILVNRDGERVTPSVVMFEGSGNAVVGDQAKDNSVVDPLDVVQFVKRYMGDKNYSFEDDSGKKYSAEEISAMILKRLKSDAEDDTGEKVDGAVITVPAYFDDVRRTATKDAGEIAGLNVLGIINEPTAAALAYCHDEANSDGNVMVFDLGGGTFDVTVLKLSDNLKQIDILSTNGNRNLGGFDFDNEIINKIAKDFKDKYGVDLEDDDEALQDLRLKAENAKKALSSRQKTMISVRSSGNAMKEEITRDEFEKMIKKHLDTMQGFMEMALEDANLKWEDINKVLLVGGSTRIPAVQNMIQNVSGIVPSHELNPDEAVAIGAAYYADTLANGESENTQEKVKITDVNSHSVGTITVSEPDPMTGLRHFVMTPIIKRNSHLPVTQIAKFFTAEPDQTKLNIQIAEGEDEDPTYDTIIGETMLTMDPKPVGYPIIFVMHYDVNGMIHTSVKDGKTGGDLGELKIERDANLSDAEIDEKKEALKDINIE